MKFHLGAALSLFMALSLTACEEKIAAPIPDAIGLPDDAIGYFCGMIVKNHEGPKGQIFIEGQAEPRWFTSVRDALAYTRLPEETSEVTAIYVSDMGQAASWEQPGDDAWIPGHDAYFVLGSSKMGGMGAAEAVPFSTQSAALDFTATYGGTVMRMDDIPTHQLLGSDEDSHDH